MFFFLRFFLIWNIFKVFIEFVIITASILCFDHEACGISDQASTSHPLHCMVKSQPLNQEGNAVFLFSLYLFAESGHSSACKLYVYIYSQILFSQYINLGKLVLVAKQSIKQNSHNSCLLSSILFFLDTSCGRQDLSSPTWD